MSVRLAAGLCSVTFRALSPGEVVALAAANGILGIEWGSDKHVPPRAPGLAREVAARCRDNGIAVCSIGSYVEAGARQGQPFPAVLDVAAIMGAPNIRVWAGKRGVGAADATAAERAAAADALHEMAASAAKLGVTVSLEFHPDTLTDTLQSTLDLLKAADHATLKTYWQPGPGIGLAEALDQVAALEGQLSHLHVFSWTAVRQRLPLAARTDFWPPILRRSLESPFAGPMPRYALLEFVANDDPAMFRNDARTLATWIAAAASAGSAP